MIKMILHSNKLFVLSVALQVSLLMLSSLHNFFLHSDFYTDVLFFGPVIFLFALVILMVVLTGCYSMFLLVNRQWKSAGVSIALLVSGVIASVLSMVIDAETLVYAT